jgi:hypothetical protein
VLFNEIREFSDKWAYRKGIAGIFVDFAFLPPAHDRKTLDKANLPWFFGRASRHSPADFDLIMVSNAFALELINLPYLFSTAGIPMRSSLRMKMERAPLVILGGSNAVATGSIVERPKIEFIDIESRIEREPHFFESMVDGIFFGEGEGIIGELSGILTGLVSRESGFVSAQSDRGRMTPRSMRLIEAQMIQGFWACEFPAKAKRSVISPRPAMLTSPLVLNGPNANSTKLAITSGCPGYCSFCLEGWDRRPYKEASLDEIVAAAKETRVKTGTDTLEIYSFNFNTHTEIFKIIFELNRVFRRVSFMSQRVDILADTPFLLDAELAGGKRSFTLGIEGISGKMRAYYRKGITDKQIFSCVDALIRPGIKEIKFFFILSGSEDEEDVSEFEKLIADIAERRRSHAPSIRMLVSTGYLVRLPFTPLQFAPIVLDRQKLESTARSMQKICETKGVEFRLASEFTEFAVDQVLSMGGGSLLPWLEKLPALGFVYDSGINSRAWSNLKSFCVNNNILNDDFLGEKSESFRPPLFFVEDESHHRALYRNYRAASAFEDRPPCLGKTCSACGACVDGEEIANMTGHADPRTPSSSWIDKIKTISTIKSAFPSITAIVSFSSCAAFSTSAYRACVVQRAISKNIPGAEKALFESTECIFSEKSPFNTLIPDRAGRWGRTAFSLFGPNVDMLMGASRRFSTLVSEKSSHLVRGRTDILEFLPVDFPPDPDYVDLRISLPRSASHEGMACLETWMRGYSLQFSVNSVKAGKRYPVSASSWGKKIVYAAIMDECGTTTCLSIRVGKKASLDGLIHTLGERIPGIAPIEILGWGNNSGNQGSHLAMLESVSKTSTAESGNSGFASASRSKI